jgi:CubicO group peptidase (beta-lactamase class C family)
MKLLLKAAVIFILSIAPAIAKEQPKITDKIEQLVQTAHQYIGFNGTVLVAKSGNIIYHKAFGFADKNQQIPLTTDHKFSPGSVGKEFTTVALMILRKQGKLDYSDTLSSHLTGLPQWASSVTIEHILTHTSGLPDIKWQRQRATTTQDVVQQINAIKSTTFTPGSGYRYGNINTMLRALIVEKATGKPFEHFLQKQLFDASGMKGTITRSQVAQMQSSIVEGTSPSDVVGLTAYLTAKDIYQWERSLYYGSLVNREILEKTIISHKHNERPNRSYFDFGRFVREDERLTQVLHDGSHQRHKVVKFSDFDNQLTVVLMSSDGNKPTLYDIQQQISSLDKGEPLQIPTSWWLVNGIKLHGGVASIKTLKALVKTGEQPIPSEGTLNTMGFRLSGDDRLVDALVILKYALECYPTSANAHDSYAEVLILAKRFELATPIIEKGLKLAKQTNNALLLKTLAAHAKVIGLR